MVLKHQFEGVDERKKKIWDLKMNFREDSIQYGHLGVFIRHDPAEIRGFVVVAPHQSRDFPFF
jgi:hypothetical protein